MTRVRGGGRRAGTFNSRGLQLADGTPCNAADRRRCRLARTTEKNIARMMNRGDVRGISRNEVNEFLALKPTLDDL